jgi:hypothetical protein
VIFQHRVIAEPELEFGSGGQHVDPRYGLTRHGPLQAMPGDKVRIGVIGTAETIEGFSAFLDRARVGIEPKKSRLTNLFPPFPGLGNENPFRCSFEIAGGARRTLVHRDIGEIVTIKDHDEAVRAAADLFTDQARSLLESSDRPDVIVNALPFPLIERLVNGTVSDDEEAEQVDGDLNFRDLLKARTLDLRAPSQILWPTAWDDSAKIPRKLKETNRRVQDPATRAWNIFNALFYKAGRVPWRLAKASDQLLTSYIGIGFYRDTSGQQLLTSTAQMFDERGRGLILRGGRARTDKGDLHPYLDRESAYDLVRRSLQAFYTQHGHFPARVVVLKTSRYDASEADGINEAMAEATVRYRDLIWVQESSPVNMFREGDYPPLRGTCVKVGNEALLFTRGSVPHYRTYPGMRVPRPLHLRPHTGDTPIMDTASDLLALSKMNWNTTQFDGAQPIPIRAARQVGRVLKHLPIGQVETSDYRMYI